MSQISQSFIDQLEAAATPAVIGTKKSAAALAPSEFKTSQQDKLGDMKSYKRRQKKMEKGLLNQEVEIDEEDYPTSMAHFPAQIDPEDDDGEWVTGDPTHPIDWDYKGDPIKKAYKQVKKDRTSGSHSGVEEALGELASLFHGITGQEPEEEPKAFEPLVIPLPEPEPIVPYIDPRVIEQATNELQSLFSDMSGVELFGERLEEEEVIEIPVTPPETFDISEVSSVTTQIFGGHHKALDTTLYDPTNYKHTQVVQDVDELLEKHKEVLPETEYKILKTDAADKTAAYLSKLNLTEYDTSQSMPFTGANSPLVSSGQFTTAVTGILRKMMATGPGTGVVELDKLDDVDPDGKVAGYVLAYQPNTAPTKYPFKWQSPLTPPAGDINNVIAGDGLTGGGDSGAVTLNAAGTSNRISVSADAIDIASTYVGQNTITTLGTIGTGIWQGTAVANAYIGTGVNATKLADGTVTNTELQYINSLSSNAQTQLDSKPGSSFVTAMAIALG